MLFALLVRLAWQSQFPFTSASSSGYDLQSLTLDPRFVQSNDLPRGIEWTICKPPKRLAWTRLPHKLKPRRLVRSLQRWPPLPSSPSPPFAPRHRHSRSLSPSSRRFDASLYQQILLSLLVSLSLIYTPTTLPVNILLLIQCSRRH